MRGTIYITLPFLLAATIGCGTGVKGESPDQEPLLLRSLSAVPLLSSARFDDSSKSPALWRLRKRRKLPPKYKAA